MMGEMPLWLIILWALGGLMAIFVFLPGIKASMEQTRNAENKDWAGFMLPIAVVILFVAFLITLVRS